MRGELLTRDEEIILKSLFPDKKGWLRDIVDTNPGFNTTTAKRSLKKLEEKKLVVSEKNQDWRRGQKIHFALTARGKSIASKLIVGDAGKDLFIKILGNLLELSKSYDGEGAREAEIAIDIVNSIDTIEAGKSIEKIVTDLRNSLVRK